MHGPRSEDPHRLSHHIFLYFLVLLYQQGEGYQFLVVAVNETSVLLERLPNHLNDYDDRISSQKPLSKKSIPVDGFGCPYSAPVPVFSSPNLLDLLQYHVEVLVKGPHSAKQLFVHCYVVLFFLI
jgi:hypothetical protein